MLTGEEFLVGVVLVGLVMGLVAAAIVVLVKRSRSTSSAGPSIAALELEEVRREATDIRQRADAEAAEIRRQAEALADHAAHAREEADLEIRAIKDELRELRLDLERRENRLAEREEVGVSSSVLPA